MNFINRAIGSTLVIETNHSTYSIFVSSKNIAKVTAIKGGDFLEGGEHTVTLDGKYLRGALPKVGESFTADNRYGNGWFSTSDVKNAYWVK